MKKQKLNSVENSVWIFDVVWYASLKDLPTITSAFKTVAKKYIFQLEKGKEKELEHFQCTVNLKERSWHTGKPLGALLNSLGMNGASARPASNAGKASLKKYVTKADTRIAGPWADCPIYLGRDLGCMCNPYPWQHHIMDMIKRIPNDRKIIWIDDSHGNVGKSKLLKHLCFNGLAKRIPMGNATQLKTNVITQGAARVYCVDIPRTIGSTEKMHDLISAIEEVKNGWVGSAMYGKHQELYMEPPHVLCFSNMPPPRLMMSQDRWSIYKVNPLLKCLSNLSKM
jgi:hypothetical protein